MKAIIFDLDDTLYPEVSFVESGFGAVAQHLDERFGLGRDQVLGEMVEIFRRQGRGKIFDSVLRAHGIYSDERASLLVWLYRSHHPKIRLYDDVEPTFRELRDFGYRLGILTDGMAAVQRRKVAALGLDGLCDVVLCSDELGREYWKPAARPYQVLLEMLGACAEEAAYVGNDVQKDFIWPNAAGMLTIEVRHPSPHAAESCDVPLGARACHVASCLSDVLPVVSRSFHTH